MNQGPINAMSGVPIKMAINPPVVDPKSNRRQVLSNISVRFSPFEQTKTRLVVAQAHNFGIIGQGGLTVYDLADQQPTNPKFVQHSQLQTIQQIQAPETQFDVCFNEANASQILSACGDGTLKLWEINGQQMQSAPLAVLRGHQAEVQSCEWSHINKMKVLSSSTDRIVKLWDMQTLSQGGQFMSQLNPQGSFQHEQTAYQAIWHPTHESIFASCSGDQMCRVWDLRSGKDVKKIHAHTGEILALDFNKYENFIATCGTDNMIKVFDLRSNLDQPMMELVGHQLAVRKIKFSPYHANILASTSYDMSVRIWDCNNQKIINQFEHHSEFVTGLDFNLFVEGMIATVGWDGVTAVYNMQENPSKLKGIRQGLSQLPQ